MTHDLSTSGGPGGGPAPWPGAGSAVRLYVDDAEDGFHHIIAARNPDSGLMKRVLARAHSLGFAVIEADDVNVDPSDIGNSRGELEILLTRVNASTDADGRWPMADE